MKTSNRFSNRRRRRGLTLIEVVAGLALMATLLVTMLVLKSRFAHQTAAATARLRGVSTADSLLQMWWIDPAKFPVGQSGTIAGLNWQTRVVADETVARVYAKKVRLEISDAKFPAPLAAVDVVLPMDRTHAP